jgi:hypothetical protein
MTAIGEELSRAGHHRSPLLTAERAALVRSYAALLVAVHR